MSSQSKLIKDILSLYDTILENKEISEAEDVYNNIEFKDKVVGDSIPSNDNINITLLQDVQNAAKKANVTVGITTAISGHQDSDSERHRYGNAVDIAIINGIGSGKATNDKDGNAKFRELGNKLKDALVSMGYVWNSESGNPKAVLWQTNTGGNHYNHVHVSNTTNSAGNTDTKPDTKTDTKTGGEVEPETPDLDSLISGVTDIVLPMIGIKEEKIVKDNWFKKKKLNENIDRIKGLL